MSRSNDKFLRWTKLFVLSVAFVWGFQPSNTQAQIPDLGAIPYAGGYVNMTQQIMSGDLGAIPYAGGYINMAQQIMSGDLGAIPYAGGYINMAQNISSNLNYCRNADWTYNVNDLCSLSSSMPVLGEQLNSAENNALLGMQLIRSPQVSEINQIQSTTQYNDMLRLFVRTEPKYTGQRRLTQPQLEEIEDFKSFLENPEQSENFEIWTTRIKSFSEDPKFSQSLCLARVLFQVGLAASVKKIENNQIDANLMIAKAEEIADRALGDDPMYPVWLEFQAASCMIGGKYDEAEKMYLKAKEIREKNKLPERDEYLIRLYLGRVHVIRRNNSLMIAR